MEAMITLITFILGIATCVLSVAISLHFHAIKKNLSGHPKQLTHALEWQLIGEAAIGLGTLIFTVSAMMGWLEHWTVSQQNSLRVAMFLATSLTTIHLYKVTLLLKSVKK